MGSRTLPMKCKHGNILDWGDFGPDPDDGSVGIEPCAACELEESTAQLKLMTARNERAAKAAAHLGLTSEDIKALADYVIWGTPWGPVAPRAKQVQSPTGRTRPHRT